MLFNKLTASLILLILKAILQDLNNLILKFGEFLTGDQ